MKINLVIILTVVSSFACSSQNFSAGGSGPRSSSDGKRCVKTKTKDCKEIVTDPGVDTTPNSAIQHEAVFAVRNVACALCHAKIDSNIISDFAINSDKTSAAHVFDQINYSMNHAKAGTQSISGKFIVPAGDTYVAAASAAGKVSNCSFDSLGKVAPSYVEVSVLDSLNKCVKPFINWSNPAEAFVARKSVEIAPVNSPDTIRSLADAAKLTTTGYAAVQASTITGLTRNQNGGIVAAATLPGEGAVVADGPLLLKNVTIQTTKGCRIYSTASIFVFGNLTVSGPAESAHVQLMSPVFVGFEISSADADKRLQHGVNKLYSYSIGTALSVANKITADATKVGAQAGGAGAFSYTKVAASAPVVYSRSSGQFSGVIIAEQFLGRIGSLNFVFDPVFKKGPSAPQLFPEINRQLVTVSAD
jgi:hypothetical protein